MTVGVDVGGTFTDVVRWNGERVLVAKMPSTSDQSEGVAAGASLTLQGVSAPLLVHGTTVATNALLERSGAEVVLVTDAGFEDVIEIGRQHRPALYDPEADRPEPLVPRKRRIGWPVDALPPPGEGLAVALIHGYAHPEREREVGERLAEAGWDPDAMVLAGVELPEFREFERSSTAVLTAYLRPVVGRYLSSLVGRVVPALAERLLVMRSSGGLIAAEEARRQAASILLSGPAGGVVAAGALGTALGYGSVVSFDMGGTSTDVCRIEDGRPELVYEREVDGYVCRLPSVAVHTVGAGGGSLGWIDSGGALRVGPQSAGADPGPASYLRGGVDPAVTDADLHLGRIDHGRPLGGSVQLSRDAASAALGRLGERLGMSAGLVAEGMVEVVEAHMERAIRRVSVEEGSDPRQSILVAFGGAGGMHATAVARRLEMGGVVVPPFAGVFSALGLLLSPPRIDRSRTVLAAAEDVERMEAVLADTAAEAAEELEGSTGLAPEEVETLVDVRYLGQAHETTVPHRPGDGWELLASRFHRLHHRRNGFSRPEDPIEAVTVRAAARGRPVLTWDRLPEHVPQGEAARGTRPVRHEGATLVAQVWERAGLDPGAELAGPAIVADFDATVFLRPGDRARLHPSGALEIEW